MDWLWTIFWFGGLWFCGSFVIGAFGTQIGIILLCTKRLMRRIRNDHMYWDSAACNSYLNRTIAINAIIILAASALVLWLLPSAAVWGYFIGAAFTLITSMGAMGMTEANANESCQIFLRFAKPGMEKEMAELIPMLASQAVFEAMIRK